MAEQYLNMSEKWYKNIKNFVNSMFLTDIKEAIETDDIELELIVPANVIYRTQMICDYISKQLGIKFEIYDFIMSIYMEFIDNSIKKYEPLNFLKVLSRSYSNVVKISCEHEEFEYEKGNENKKLVIITITKDDSKRGQVLLYELEELYGTKISLDKMFNSIWINFIEEYKHGKSNEAINNLMKTLKEQNKELIT